MNVVELNIGDFIQVNWPDRTFTGQVLDVKNTFSGEDGARRVLLELNPNTHRTSWFIIDPGEFELV